MDQDGARIVFPSVRGVIHHNWSKNSKSLSHCCGVRRFVYSSSRICWEVRFTALFSSSKKNSDIVILKAEQIRSMEGIVGIIFLRYQVEIVDCGRSARAASWYSVQLRCSLSSVIRCSTSMFLYLFSSGLTISLQKFL